MTFHTIPPAPNDKCYECGEPAVIVLVNEYTVEDSPDELPLCETHWKDILNEIPSD